MELTNQSDEVFVDHCVKAYNKEELEGSLNLTAAWIKASSPVETREGNLPPATGLDLGISNDSAFKVDAHSVHRGIRPRGVRT